MEIYSHVFCWIQARISIACTPRSKDVGLKGKGRFSFPGHHQTYFCFQSGCISARYWLYLTKSVYYCKFFSPPTLNRSIVALGKILYITAMTFCGLQNSPGTIHLAWIRGRKPAHPFSLLFPLTGNPGCPDCVNDRSFPYHFILSLCPISASPKHPFSCPLLCYRK